ncbi:MAG: hypothetical protein C0608_11260 [Deltaproteobacteria bacterium]|nr:MAG: hypothetical protein C0608_11260 [Deltaproteobacteria bacterium]
MMKNEGSEGAIYEFASAAGALEGFIYKRDGVEERYLEDWVSNLRAQYDDLSPDLKEALQPAINRTLGRALHSLKRLFGENSRLFDSLSSIVQGALPSSDDDFDEEKVSKATKYKARKSVKA